MSTWPQQASGARGSGVQSQRGAGGWVGYRSVRKTSLLIECFVTPATQGVYRKTFAETMFLLNPKDFISFSRQEICRVLGTAGSQYCRLTLQGPGVLKILITVSHLPLLFSQLMMDDACETCTVDRSNSTQSRASRRGEKWKDARSKKKSFNTTKKLNFTRQRVQSNVNCQ